MPDTQRRYAAAGHVVATEFDNGDGVLVDLNAKRYYQLNETAMLVWRAVERGATLAEIARQMTDEYDVSSEHANASIERALRNLCEHKLVENGEP